MSLEEVMQILHSVRLHIANEMSNHITSELCQSSSLTTIQLTMLLSFVQYIERKYLDTLTKKNTKKKKKKKKKKKCNVSHLYL